MVSIVPQLEPSWDNIDHLSKIDTLCECIIWDPTGTKHLVRTALAKRVFRVFGTLPQACAYSFLDAKFWDKDSKGIYIDESTIVLAHNTPSTSAFREVVELCSGIGVMSFGLEHAGAKIQVRNDIRTPLVEFQQHDGTQHVIEGDIGDNKTLQKIFEIHPASAILTCGFSCQPWSALGDRRKFDDGRAQTLLYTLRAAYFLSVGRDHFGMCFGFWKGPWCPTNNPIMVQCNRFLAYRLYFEPWAFLGCTKRALVVPSL